MLTSLAKAWSFFVEKYEKKLFALQMLSTFFQKNMAAYLQQLILKF